MKQYDSFSELWGDLENDEIFQAESVKLDFVLQLHQLMEKRGITKKDIAKSIGSSQAYITKVFKGNVNFTIDSMAKLANAAHGKLTIHITGKEELNPKWYRAIEGRKKTSSRWNINSENVIYSTDEPELLEVA
jgi:transcriptional regulator with XRE-family HTH domain